MANNTHIWNERTADGDKREVKAVKFGGEWTLSSKLKSQGYWTKEDPPGKADLEKLRELLWNKYQRKRLPHSDVEAVDALIYQLEE